MHQGAADVTTAKITEYWFGTRTMYIPRLSEIQTMRCSPLTAGRLSIKLLIVAGCIHAALYTCTKAEGSISFRVKVIFWINKSQEIREKYALLTKIRKGVLNRQYRDNLSPGRRQDLSRLRWQESTTLWGRTCWLASARRYSLKKSPMRDNLHLWFAYWGFA